MNRNNYRGHLSSKVESDGCLESRIPILGLHMDNIEGFSKEACLSGPVDSGIASMGSIYDSGFETSVDCDMAERIDQMSLKSKEAEPLEEFTSVTGSMCQSVDEGFISSDITTSTEEESVSKETLVQHQELLKLFTPDEEGDTQLHIAVIQGSQVAFALVNAAAEINPKILNIQNLLGQTPVHLAVLTKQNDLLRHLLLKGAALDVRDRHGNTGLHLACRDGNLHCVHALLRPLHVDEYPLANFSCLANFSHDLTLKNYDGETCLHMAVSHGHAQTIMYLVQHAKANVDLRDGRSGRTVLHYAIEAGNLQMVQFLIQQCNADVNAQTFDGATPLKLAVGRCHSNIQNLLVRAGADSSSIHSDLFDFEESEDEEMDDVRIGGRLVRGMVA